jgi:NHS family xanthosine MFS transporter
MDNANNNIKYRLILMSFLQFFVWGSWLITIGVYWFGTKEWGADKFGAIFSTMGLASLFMPALAGIIADKWVDSEKLYSILHLLSGISLICLTQVDNPDTFFYVMLVSMIFYMPTIALSNSVAYSSLKKYNMDVVTSFPPIRVFGTVGFIAAMWIVNLTGNKSSDNQFYIAAIASFILAAYSLTLPKCPPLAKGEKNTSLSKAFGFEAFRLFKSKQMAIFLIFSMFLGAALQLTNAYGDTFLDDFKKVPEFANSYIVKYSTIVMSISQISETLFILAIPFFLKRYGIKNVMLISMAAWVLRFGLFAYGDPGAHVWMIILSCIVYGMAFDFFNISGSLYVETTTTPEIRSAAQGLFMMMTNGIGAVLGSSISGILIQNYFTNADGSKDWHHIWLTFAIYSLVIFIAFALVFKHKHNPEEIKKAQN